MCLLKLCSVGKVAKHDGHENLDGGISSPFIMSSVTIVKSVSVGLAIVSGLHWSLCTRFICFLTSSCEFDLNSHLSHFTLVELFSSRSARSDEEDFAAAPWGATF